MKKIEHETWTEYAWEKGDMVRLKDTPHYGAPSGIRRAQAGEFGVVTDVERGGDGYFVDISMHGFSVKDDSLGGHVKASRYELVPWERAPEDGPALRERMVEFLARLSFVVGARAGHSYSTARVGVGGRSASQLTGHTSFSVAKAVLGDALPYLGDGKGSVDDPAGITFVVNEAGHALLDAAGHRRTLGMAGGGGLFELSYDRDGTYRVKDFLTGREHAFPGAEGRRLLDATHTQVGLITDGRLPEIVRETLDYPRAMRRSGDLVVIETAKDAMEVRRGEETFAVEGADAKLLRRACLRVRDLGKWVAARPELLREAEPATAPAP